MTEQLALIESPPRLTELQQFALTLVEQAAGDGAHADEIGAAWCAERGKHPAGSRCQYDGANGKQVLEALKKKGLVRYRRGRGGIAGVWLRVGAAEPRRARGMLRDDEPIPF